MNAVEVRFLEEYKSTDALCMDIYGCGISDYINAMEETSAEYRGVIGGWKDTYYSLKHLRWLRNRITHDTVATECSEKDIAAIRAFRRDLENGRDPVARANKHYDENNKSDRASSSARSGGNASYVSRDARLSPFVAAVAVAAAVLILILLIHSCV